MFNQLQYQTLFAYTWHTTRLMVDCAAKLSGDEYFADPGYGHGSVHDLLFHVLRTDYNWRVALETGQRAGLWSKQDFPTLETLQKVLETEKTAWTQLLEQLTDQDIQGDVLLTYHGELSPTPRWRILQHVVLHSMQHHTEIAALLTARGQSPGDIDFIFFE